MYNSAYEKLMKKINGMSNALNKSFGNISAINYGTLNKSFGNIPTIDYGALNKAMTSSINMNNSALENIKRIGQSINKVNTFDFGNMNFNNINFCSINDSVLGLNKILDSNIIKSFNDIMLKNAINYNINNNDDYRETNIEIQKDGSVNINNEIFPKEKIRKIIKEVDDNLAIKKDKSLYKIAKEYFVTHPFEVWLVSAMITVTLQLSNFSGWVLKPECDNYRNIIREHIGLMPIKENEELIERIEINEEKTDKILTYEMENDREQDKKIDGVQSQLGEIKELIKDIKKHT